MGAIGGLESETETPTRTPADSYTDARAGFEDHGNDSHSHPNQGIGDPNPDYYAYGHHGALCTYYPTTTRQLLDRQIDLQS